MRHLKRLKEFELQLEAYQELEMCEFDCLVDELREFFDEYAHEFTPEEDDVFYKAEDLANAHEGYFRAIADQEWLDQLRDEQQYLRSECNH